jgi:predicted molibdopterin-dependent oxidoreductase YjgC
MNKTDANTPGMQTQSKTFEEYQKAFENYEMEYWCKKFGVSKERLKQAIAKVGFIASDVEHYLKSNAFG